MVRPVGKAEAFVPERGDIVWLQFEPHLGHEQAGRRSALVLSPQSYNARAGLALCCPLTSQVKGYPFEVLLPEQSKARGVVLADQVKSLDWRARRAEKFDVAADTTVAEVLAKLELLLKR